MIPTLFRLFLIGLVLLPPCAAFAQNSTPHADHFRFFHRASAKREADYSAALDTSYQHAPSTKCLPTKQVYGWHPAWSGTAYEDYDFPLLNTVSYFGYMVDASTGGYTTLNNWMTTDLIAKAHDGGSRIDLTAACFGSSSLTTLFGKQSSLQNLQDSLISLIIARDADGVCIDFEGLGSALRNPYTKFIASLADTLHKLQPRRTLTLTLPAVDWSNAFDLAALAPLADRFALMAYDFHYSGSSQTGAVAPETDVRKAVDRCLTGGIPSEKLLLGIPYYGYDWPTAANTPHTSTKGKGSAVIFRHRDSTVLAMTAMRDSIDPWWYPADAKSQVWCDDSISIDDRMGIVAEKNLAGIAIWALGYDHGSDTYWNLIRKNFADCSAEDTQTEPVADPTKIPGSGVSSAERNEYHWVWMLGGGLIAIGIILLVRRLLR